MGGGTIGGGTVKSDVLQRFDLLLRQRREIKGGGKQMKEGESYHILCQRVQPRH